ncbi:MAG: VWA domain-containing protein [Burkholderiales bacterium]|nr:VWA domain-containing protein [Burkholderiales bacterium]
MKKIHQFFAGFLILLALAACDKSSQSSANHQQRPVAAEGNTFRILAGSELKDVADLVQAFGRSMNINVQFDYTGTLDAVDRLADGGKYDAVWVSHGKYLQLIPEVKNQIKASEKTMYSRVVLGVKRDAANKLGWKSGKTGWNDVVKAAKAGKFRFAMTNPTGSNTGFVALAGLAAELSGKGDALEVKDIPADKLKELFAGQSMTAGSSGVLADMFAATPDKVDGIINYESVIRSMASKGQALEVIIPKEGVITADYPLMLLSNSAQQSFYQKLLEYLRSDSTQKQIAASTFRTPLAGSGSDEVVNELPFPGSLAVVEAILKGFLDDFSKPSTSFYVLDVSGSMEGARIKALRDSMLALAQGDASASGRFSTFRARERVYMIPFNHAPLPMMQFDLSESAEKNKPVVEQMRQSIQRLEAGGGTAIFSAVASIYEQAQQELINGDRLVSIIVETDGDNRNGISLTELREFVYSKGEPRVPIFAILFGDGNPREMQALAEMSRGKVFDAKKVKLSKVMKEIRTYQ